MRIVCIGGTCVVLSLLAGAVGLLAADSPSVQDLLGKAQHVSSLQYDYTSSIEINGSPFGGIYKGTLWQKGSLKKMTLTGGMMQSNMVTQYATPQGTFVCQEEMGPCSQQTQMPFPITLADVLKNHPGMKTSIVGTDVIDGKHCTIIKASLDVPVPGAIVSKYCLWNDHGIALRIEDTAAMASDRVTRMEVHNLSLKPLPDGLFTIAKERLENRPGMGINSMVIFPSAIPAGKPTLVKITITLEPGMVHPNSVSLMEVQPGHGSHTLAGVKEGQKNIVENVLEREITLTEKTPRTMHLQVVIKVPGHPEEFKSHIQDIFVQNPHEADHMLQQLAEELESGDIQAAQRRFADAGKSAGMLQELTPEKRKTLAKCFRDLRQTQATENYLMYKGPMRMPNGETSEEEVMLAMDMEGHWVIGSW